MKKLIVIIGILAIIISVYNIISGESIKENIVGFILGIGFTLSYFERDKLKK